MSQNIKWFKISNVSKYIMFQNIYCLKIFNVSKDLMFQNIYYIYISEKKHEIENLSFFCNIQLI